jgi:hypothetical protein
MPARKSIWLDVLDWMKCVDARLPAVFPPELPAESSPGFWFRVAEVEMSTRESLSVKIRSLVAGDASAMSLLDAWLYRRRVEWAVQLAIAKA